MSCDTSKLGGFAITILGEAWSRRTITVGGGPLVDAFAPTGLTTVRARSSESRSAPSPRPATSDQVAVIRTAARAVLAKGDDYRRFLVDAMDDVFGEDSTSEERIRQELDQLRSELEKASVYDTDEFERLNTASTPPRASSS